MSTLARLTIATLLLLASCASLATAAGTAGDEPTPRAAASVVLDLAGQAAERAGKADAAAADPLGTVTGRTETPSLTKQEAMAIADTSEDVHEWLDDHPVVRTTAEFEEDDDQWKVSYVSRNDERIEKVEAQVFVVDDEGRIDETRVGPQVNWMMARGSDRAFGRAINKPVIWWSLAVIFLIPLLTPRRLLSWRTLDLLALLSFSASWIFFNRGEIFTSVPLVYPPLVYLALRLGWIGVGRVRRERDATPEERPPPRARVPSAVSLFPTWLVGTLLIVVLALRYGLNAFDANVIDVGYAGVIGADRVSNGVTPYGNMPSDCGNCDTYGPLNYIAYVPFEWAMPFEGRWNDLPAAHGAATLFDILTLAGMLFLGWRLAGMRLGLLLGLAWAAYPFSGYVLESNANDSLVAATLIWGLAVARSPVGRGLGIGLAISAKLSPAVLLPLWSRHPYPRAARGLPARLALYGAGVAGAGVLTGWVLLLDGLTGVRAFYSRTVGYQLGRESPFSIWGQHTELRPLQIGVMVAVGLAAIVVLRWPRRLDLLGMAALSAALLIGFQLTMTHWFYLYLVWFAPLALVAFVPAWERPPRASAPRAPVARESAPAPEPAPSAPR